VIRQAISCDICGTEKKQTNHWFVARESGGELHVGGWNSRNRSRAGAKHLCGQTCLHKLVDEFMARTISSRGQMAAAEQPDSEIPNIGLDTSLTSRAAYVESQPAARLVAMPETLPTRRAPAPIAASAAADRASMQTEAAFATLADETPHYASRSWRAEAWERERERELRSAERRPEIAARRRRGHE
jgi:hypothetical protein